MKTNRVTLITLAVAEPKRARAYYEALGWELEEDVGEAVFYAMDGMKFGFFTLEGLAAETGRPVEALKTGFDQIDEGDLEAGQDPFRRFKAIEEFKVLVEWLGRRDLARLNDKLSLVASFLQGTFSHVSGGIGRLKPEAVKMRTPVGTIGIRGTKFVVRVP